MTEVTPESTPTSQAPKSPMQDILTPRVDALREKLAQDRMASSARKERKKSLEGSGDARSTIEGMLTARRTARKQSLELSAAAGPPEWFTTFKQGMEARVSDLENQLEEKTDEVQQLRERVAALEEAQAGGAPVKRNATNASPDQNDSPQQPAPKVPSMVPKLSLGGSAPVDKAVADVKAEEGSNPRPSKLASPKTRPATASAASTGENSPKDSPKSDAPKKQLTMAEKKKIAEIKKREGGWK